jgi:hypothetical protein
MFLKLQTRGDRLCIGKVRVLGKRVSRVEVKIAMILRDFVARRRMSRVKVSGRRERRVDVPPESVHGPRGGLKHSIRRPPGVYVGVRLLPTGFAACDIELRQASLNF